MKLFSDLADFSAKEISGLLTLANRLQTNPEPHALEGKVLALLFMSPSLRTLASFQSAMVRLGGGAFIISPDMSIHGLETRPGIVMDGMAAEHIREAVPVIASYADAIGIRAFAERRSLDDDLADQEFNNMSHLCEIPLINMESAINHPCQSLGDWKTMDDLDVPRQGGKFVLSWAYHPRALPLAVPAATVHMAAMRGMDVTVLRPDGFALPDPIMEKASKAAEAAGGVGGTCRRPCPGIRAPREGWTLRPAGARRRRRERPSSGRQLRVSTARRSGRSWTGRRCRGRIHTDRW